MTRKWMLGAFLGIALSTAPAFPRKAVRYDIYDGPPASADDPNRLSAPENVRGFENNRIVQIGRCGGAHP